jgi:hypothetical protein
MKGRTAAPPADQDIATVAKDDLRTLLAASVDPRSAPSPRIDGVVVGRVLALAGHGTTPLVAFPGQSSSAAQPARSTIDLHAAHVGRAVVLMFEEGDPVRPIVIGCLAEDGARTLPDLPGSVEVDVDGRRLVVTATEQLVLRCGAASVTLTREGKILLRGTYVSSHSSGVQRIRGGSVQIN